MGGVQGSKKMVWLSAHGRTRSEDERRVCTRDRDWDDQRILHSDAIPRTKGQYMAFQAVTEP